MACSSTCPTQDCPSYGACLRRKNLRVAYCRSAVGGGDYTEQKAADKELALFREAVAEGHEPESTRTLDILSAMEYGDRTGEAFKAEPEPEFLSGEAAREGVFA